MFPADPPYHALGYPPPPDSYNPLIHPSLAPGEGVKLFPAWVSGYYLHGNSPSSLEHRVALQDPPPTILTMSLEEIQGALYDPPTIPGGSDALQVEIEEAKNSGKPLRNISLMRLSRANHFVSHSEPYCDSRTHGPFTQAHWDQPERALKALLSDAPEEHPSHL